MSMALHRRWTVVRFESRLAAQDAVNRMMQYAYTLDQAEMLSGPGRVIVWSTLVFSPTPTVYLNRAALALAERLQVILPNRQIVTSDQLPDQRTLLLGLPKDDERGLIDQSQSSQGERTSGPHASMAAGSDGEQPA